MQVLDSKSILVGARTSPLSLAQVKEVQAEIRRYYPQLQLELLPISTTGDKDQKTSLRSLDKTDFFTREIDQALLEERCRVAIHSAKDLPFPLPAGLSVIALTQGVDHRDSLVLKEGATLDNLPVRSRIATSSSRRDETILKLRSDLVCIDVRGPIHQRLRLLETHQAEGVVIAEAALIRLELTHLNRVLLPGPTTPLQGRLAIVARQDDNEMATLFQAIDHRSVHLYVGLTPPPASIEHKIIHRPFISIQPRVFSEQQLTEIKQQFAKATHLIFTSKTSVFCFFDLIPDLALFRDKTLIAVGHSTAEELAKYNLYALVATTETAEGICQLLDTLPLENSYIFWPHSALSRSVISNYLAARQVNSFSVVLYDTLPISPSSLPDLKHIHCVHFTSPSTVAAFLKCYHQFPADISYSCIGPITQAYLDEILYKHSIFKR